LASHKENAIFKNREKKKKGFERETTLIKGEYSPGGGLISNREGKSHKGRVKERKKSKRSTFIATRGCNWWGKMSSLEPFRRRAIGKGQKGDRS